MMMPIKSIKNFLFYFILISISNVQAQVCAAGESHTLSICMDGSVKAWGFNGHGQLGNGSITDSNLPIQVNSLINVIAVAAGSEFSLALKSDGTVWAWGDNGNGQLGNGNNTDSNFLYK